MSEPIAYNSERIYWAVEQVEQEAGDIDNLHLDDNLFYIRSEADKMIAYLKNEIEEQKCLRDMALASVPNVLKVMKIIQHHKYKRCLAMAKWCKSKQIYLHSLTRIYSDKELWEYASDYWIKWSKCWLKLAEKFKEAKQ